MNCAVCRKSMGLNATLKGRNACKKHKHILLTHVTDETERENVRSVGFMNTETGREEPVRNLEDYERGAMQGAFFLFRS